MYNETNRPAGDDDVEQLLLQLGLDASHVHPLQQTDHADDDAREDRWKCQLIEQKISEFPWIKILKKFELICSLLFEAIKLSHENIF